MSTLSERLRAIREVELKTREEFSKEIGIPKRTVEGIENEGRSPRSDVIEAVASCYPQYAFWLITGKTNPPNHISPENLEAEKIKRVFEFISHPRPELAHADLMIKPEWISQVTFLQISTDRSKVLCLLTTKQQERAEITQCMLMEGRFNFYSNAKGKLALRDLADFFISIGREDLILTSDLKVIREGSAEKIYVSWEVAESELMIPDLSKVSWLKEVYINFTAWRQQKKEYQPKFYEDDKDPENLWAANENGLMIYTKDEE